jgi:hypothetical protein
VTAQNPFAVSPYRRLAVSALPFPAITMLPLMLALSAMSAMLALCSCFIRL